MSCDFIEVKTYEQLEIANECDSLIQEVVRLEVVEVAIQGPPGPGGGGGGSTYTHIQSTPLATWTVAHNLNRFPSITVVDNLGNQIYPDVRYIDNDIIQVTHSVPLTGRAYCN